MNSDLAVDGIITYNEGYVGGRYEIFIPGNFLTDTRHIIYITVIDLILNGSMRRFFLFTHAVLLILLYAVN